MTNILITQTPDSKHVGVIFSLGIWTQAIGTQPTALAVLKAVPTGPGIYEGAIHEETTSLYAPGTTIEVPITFDAAVVGHATGLLSLTTSAEYNMIFVEAEAVSPVLISEDFLNIVKMHLPEQYKKELV